VRASRNAIPAETGCRRAPSPAPAPCRSETSAQQKARRAKARDLPLVAIGGITLETASSVLEAGAASVAVIGDLVVSGDPEARARAYLERLSRWEPPRV